MPEVFRGEIFDNGREVVIDGIDFFECQFKDVNFISTGKPALFASCSFGVSASEQLERLIGSNHDLTRDLIFRDIVQWRGEDHGD